LRRLDVFSDIMLLAEEQPAHAHKLLLRAAKMHRELSGEMLVKSLFAAMVDVARAERSTRRQLTATACDRERPAGDRGAALSSHRRNH